MIKKEVVVPDVGIFILSPRIDSVIIELRPLSALEAMPVIVIRWEEMTDFDALCEKCMEMKLKAFRPLVEALGIMYSNRRLYEALIK
jgi:hypothetical protein